MVTFVIIFVVSASLLIGATWGLYGRLPKQLEGFLVAMAGGALIVAVIVELVQPATEAAPLWSAMLAVAVGALVFTFVDLLIKKQFGSKSGGGLLAAITLDGIPENLSLGVALIGAGFSEVAALAGSIFLSNLPEAAGSAKEMRGDGRSKLRVLGIWALTAGLLSMAALGGNLLLADVDEVWLALIRSFAAGAVIASLATEVFPKAFREDRQMSGIAASIGLIAAYALSELPG